MLPPKNETFQITILIFFHISAENVDCGYSLEPPPKYPQSMVLNRNNKNNVYPCKVQFNFIKVGFKGSTLYRRVSVMKCCFWTQRTPPKKKTKTRKLGFIESLHIQQCTWQGCMRSLPPAEAIFYYLTL